MIVSTSSHTVQLTKDLYLLANDTLHDELDRLAEDILSVDVFLDTLDTSKHGADKQAIIRVHLRDRREITVEAVEDSVASAIQRGSQRVKQAVCSCAAN